MSGRSIFIGDVHGCLNELKDLLKKVNYKPENGDKLYFVGDLVGKGPKSAKVVRFVREELGAFCVKGNHEDRLMRKVIWKDQLSLEEKHKPGAKGKYKPKYVKKPDPRAKEDWKAGQFNEADFEWLANLPLFIRVPEHNVIVVHAGLIPDVAPENQKECDIMYMRNIKKDVAGRLEAVVKVKDGGVPWASLWNGPETVVFGHHARNEVRKYNHAICIDTRCVYGNCLTAFVLPQKELVQVKSHKTYCKKDD